MYGKLCGDELVMAAGHLENVYELDFHPGVKLAIVLYRNVKNSKDIRQRIQQGTLQPDFAFSDATTVAGLLPVQLAANKAVTAQKTNQLHTKGLHSELICNLSGSKHVAETLRRFGISDASTNLLVARFDATEEDMQVLSELVHGEQIPLSELENISQKDIIKKYYKVSEQELKVGSLTDAVVARMAARECSS